MNGLLIGGVLASILLGIGGVFLKASQNAGISTPLFLIGFGLSISLVGVVYYSIFPQWEFTAKGITWSIFAGLANGAGIACITYAMSRGASLSKLAPLFNSNTLIQVIIALIIFSEFKDVSVTKIIAGAIFVIIGSTLAALA